MSRHVSINPLITLSHSADPVPDVYAYNFPDDKRSFKFLGKNARNTRIFCRLIGSSHQRT